MGLFILIIGIILFIAPHVLTALRPLRASFVNQLGENRYKMLYSLIAALGLALMIYGFAAYRSEGMVALWNPPQWTRHLVLTLMIPVFPLLIASYLRGNIFLKLKHPMLIGTLIWSVAHLLANGDLGSVLLFGAFFIWTHFALISLKRRTDPGAPPMPQGGLMNDGIAVGVGLALYGITVWKGHQWVIGVPVM